MTRLNKHITNALNKKRLGIYRDKESEAMSIEIHTNNDGSIALDVIIEKNHGYEMGEIVQAIEDYTIERCAVVVEDAVSSHGLGGYEEEVRQLKSPIPQTWSSGNPVHTDPEPVTTHPNNDKGHALRTEGDEYICGKCHKRWGFDDTDVPECD